MRASEDEGQTGNKRAKSVLLSLYSWKGCQKQCYTASMYAMIYVYGWGYILKTYIIVLMMYLKYNTGCYKMIF